jgi:hypothetical protein
LRRSSVPVVVGVVVYAVVSWGLIVSSSRFEDTLLVPTGTGRYSADIVPIAALGIALLTTRSVLEPSRTVLRWHMPGAVSRVGRGVLGAAAVCAVAAMVVVNTTTWWVARHSSPGPWVDAVVADGKRAGDATLVNASPPPKVMLPILFLDYATLDRMLGPLHLPLKFDEPSPFLLVPDERGHLMQADVVAVAARNQPTDNPTCGFLVRPGKATAIPMTADLYPFGWAIRLDYFAELPTRVQVTTDSDQMDIDLDAGLRSVQFKVSGPITSFRVSAASSRSPVCVTQVFAGKFRASQRSPWQ